MRKWKLNLETRYKMRLAKLGKKRTPFTTEHKQAIREAVKRAWAVRKAAQV